MGRCHRHLKHPRGGSRSGTTLIGVLWVLERQQEAGKIRGILKLPLKQVVDDSDLRV